jgi:hypothetical protein
MQLEEKKSRGPAMLSKAKITKGDLSEDPPQLKNPPELESLSATMPSGVPKDTSLPSFGDTSSSDSDMLEPDSTKIASGEKADKEEGALVIPPKATVEEKPGIDIRASIQRRAALNKPKTGKYRAPPGTAKRKLAEPDVKP